MVAKRFFFVCAGIFLLALTYHLGARSTVAVSREGPTAVDLEITLNAAGESRWHALASNGGVYLVVDRTGEWQKSSNIFSPYPPARAPADPSYRPGAPAPQDK